MARSRQYISSKVSRRLGPLCRIRSCLTLEASKQVYTLLFDYGDVEGGKISEGCWKRVTRLKNRATRMILRNNTLNDTFRVLNWLKLSSRGKMHNYILVFKCFNNLVPKYVLLNILQGMRICTIMQLGEATTCTHQSLNVTCAKELLSVQGLLLSILY